jgi:hypothetical protein
MVYETVLQHIIRYNCFWHDTFASRGWSTADFSTVSSGRNENLATMTTLDSSRLQSFIEVMWLGRHGKGSEITTGSRCFGFCFLWVESMQDAAMEDPDILSCNSLQ